MRRKFFWNRIDATNQSINQSHLLVLLEQLVGELGENLEEGDVGRRPGRIQRILQRRHGHQDALSVQARHRLSVLERVQPKGERKALRQLLRRGEEKKHFNGITVFLKIIFRPKMKNSKFDAVF